MPLATKPSPLPLPKQQLYSLPPKPWRLQRVSLRCAPVPLSPLPHTEVPPPAASATAKELTLLTGFLGAAAAGVPTRPVPQAFGLRRRLPVKARLGHHPRGHRLLPPHATGVFFQGRRLAGWPSRFCCPRGGTGTRGVSGCHGDCGSSPPPATLRLASPGVLSSLVALQLGSCDYVPTKAKNFPLIFRLFLTPILKNKLY